MFLVYAIISCDHKFIYVGITGDIADRMRRHNAGYEKATKSYIPYVLLHAEPYETRPEARQREVYLKSRSGKRLLYKIALSKITVLQRAGLSSWLRALKDQDTSP